MVQIQVTEIKCSLYLSYAQYQMLCVESLLLREIKKKKSSFEFQMNKGLNWTDKNENSPDDFQNRLPIIT
jgi:hypothetical protein